MIHWRALIPTVWPRSTSIRMYMLYMALTLAILLPLFKPGFILALDMVFTPQLRMPEAINNTYLFYSLLHFLNYILPGDVIQKLVLAAALLLSGIGMHRLIQHLDKQVYEEQEQQRYQRIGWYVAGIFYVINPYTYNRLMAGQYEVLLGYALLPFFTKAWVTFLDAPSARSAFITSLWATGIGLVSIHTLGLLAVIMVAGLVLTAVRKWRQDKAYLRRTLGYSMLALSLFILLSAYWLIPLLLGKGSTAEQIAQFSAQDIAAFATIGDTLVEKLANVLRLQGFWQEPMGWYVLPQTTVSVWNLLWLLLGLVIVIGFVHAWRNGHRFIVAVLGMTAVLAIILASGVLNSSTVAQFFVLRGFREPQKFAGLLALVYATGLGLGVSVLLQALRTQSNWRTTRIIAIAVLFVPLILTPTMPWAARGQLRAQAYPKEWFTANQVLNRDTSNFQVLFLPWHLYMYFDFTERIIANPAPDFFDKPVIVSDDPEFKGAGVVKSSETKQAIGRLMRHMPPDDTFAQQLAVHDIKYILLARENDYQDYSFLGQKPGITRIYHSDKIDIYQNQAYGEREAP